MLTSGSATTVTSVDLSAAVPPIAKGLTAQMLGDTSIATGTSSSFLYSDSGGVMLIGFERFHSVTANNSQGTMVTNGVISVASTVYYKVSAGTDDLAINVYGWGY